MGVGLPLNWRPRCVKVRRESAHPNQFQVLLAIHLRSLIRCLGVEGTLGTEVFFCVRACGRDIVIVSNKENTVLENEKPSDGTLDVCYQPPRRSFVVVVIVVLFLQTVRLSSLGFLIRRVRASFRLSLRA